jgi:hypothetical protein
MADMSNEAVFATVHRQAQEIERLRVLLLQSKRYVEHSYHEFREPDERELLAAIDAALH